MKRRDVCVAIAAGLVSMKAKSTNPNSNKHKPPSVSITTPTQGSMVSGFVTVNVSASDSTGIARVELRANGAQIGTKTIAPYSFAWDSTTVPDGAVTLSAVAYNTAGVSASATVGITVHNVVAVGVMYYVSSSLGSDNNLGTQTAPWKTLAKISNAQSLFRPGDSVLLKRGDTWNETLNVFNVVGAAGNPITYGSYGSGLLPVLDGQGIRNFAVDINTSSHIVLQDVHAINAVYDGVYLLPGAGNVVDVSIQRVVSDHNGRDGFGVEGNPGTGDVDDYECLGCQADRNGRAGFFAYNVSNGATGVHYYTCTATYNGQTVASHGFSGYVANNIHYHGCEAAFTNIDPATGLPNAASTTGSEGHGIVLDDYTSNSSIDGCNSHDNQGAGAVVAHQGSNNSASNNTLANNRTIGLVINGASGANNIQALNNVIRGNVTDGIDGWAMVNGLLIQGNTIDANGGWGISFTATGISSYTVAGNTITNNGLGPTQNV